MPTYEYRCQACQHEFEQFQSITAAALRKCPACGRNRLARLIGPGAGLIFKGSGFYITDYRSDSYRKAADAEKRGAKTDSTAPTESTAKPAAPAQQAGSDAAEAPKPGAPAAGGNSSDSPGSKGKPADRRKTGKRKVG